ncbi:e3 ubiquitin- ligase ari7 [Fusarium longipes]|uniref:E3 ubiquitin-ligase ari7 n=1 Tax=Fusarium longipes TaxID=694270 RepID=A0A395RNA3_9HYPO|nr:e3 ubiquitin- ligase ari7 [Fusarium longipes]
MTGHLRRIRSESSLERVPAPSSEVHRGQWTQNQFKEDNQPPQCPTITAPPKDSDRCEELASQIAELQACFREQREKSESLQSTVKTLTGYLLISGQHSMALCSEVMTLKRDLENAVDENKRMLEDIKEQQGNVSKLDNPAMLTRRAIIVTKMMEVSNKPLRFSSKEASTEFLGKGPHNNLIRKLDDPLDNDEAQTLLSTFDKWFPAEELNSITLATCYICKKAKFKQASYVATASPINEFNVIGSRPSCNRDVCTACYIELVSTWLESLDLTWWTEVEDPGSVSRLPCPCGANCFGVPIENRQELEDVFQSMQEGWNKRRLMKRYLVFWELMHFLGGMRSKLTIDSRNVAALLHWKMIACGFMKNPLHIYDEAPCCEEDGSAFVANDDLVQFFNMDHAGKSLSVPVFTRFLEVEKEPTECVVCTESFHDVCYDSIERWEGLCAEYSGNWMWKILLFPQKLGSSCGHKIDFCTSCLQKHIETQVEQFGRSACENITCPSEGCQRLLTYEEIKIYAKEETFVR